MGGIKGRIYKGVGGFYDVKTDNGELIQCKPRGIFRNRGIKPLAGDLVVLQQEAGTMFISEILPRKNALVRPPIANVDRLFIVASTALPQPSLLVLDKLMAYAINSEVQPVLVVSKPDLANPDELVQAYKTSGIDVIVAAAQQQDAPHHTEGLQAIRELLASKLSVFCGNTGVGKSTLLNAIAPQITREVGDVSQKLGRGRHTTREVEIFEVEGGLLADTPGFASFDLQQAARSGSGAILADNLQLCFPEIKQLIGCCKFSGCTHISEVGCAVREALQQGHIAKGRYASYVTLYQEAKQTQNKY